MPSLSFLPFIKLSELKKGETYEKGKIDLQLNSTQDFVNFINLLHRGGLHLGGETKL